MLYKSLELLKNKPKQKRSIDLVLAIFEGMDQLLKDVDLEKLSTNKVSEKAGVSIGSFYQYFKDKDQLLKAFLRNKFIAHQQLFLKEIDQLMENEPEVFIDQFCDFAFNYFKTNKTQLKALYHRVAYLGQYEFMMDHRQEVVEKIQYYLKKHHHEIDPNLKVEFAAAMMIQSAMGVFANLSYYEDHDQEVVEELKKSLKKYLHK